jgi:hypothetical protein
MAEAILGSFIIAVALIWVFIGLRKLVRVIDRSRPNYDCVAERHRKINRNGFKSRMGM